MRMNPGEPHINNLNSGLIFSSLIFYEYCIGHNILYIVYLHTEIVMYDYPPTIIIQIHTKLPKCIVVFLELRA